MIGLIVLPQNSNAAFAANLVDRPFLRHVVEFLTSQGIRKIVLIGPTIQQARTVLGAQEQFRASLEFREALSASEYQTALAAFVSNETFVLASAVSLPIFPLKRLLHENGGRIIYAASDRKWSGWALIRDREAGALPPLCDFERLESYLESLISYSVIWAEPEFRCVTAEDLWRAHRDALTSNLSTILCSGLEVKPGIWLGRNAHVAPDAKITAPAYIGENSRIGSKSHVGPFAVVAKNCLIAHHTTLRDAVVAPSTYAAHGLDLDHVFVNKRSLFDARLGVSITRVDAAIFDDVFDFPWKTIPRRLCNALASAVILVFAIIPLLLVSFWLTFRDGTWPWRQVEVLETPALEDENNWFTRRSWILVNPAGEPRTIWSRTLYRWLPALVSVLEGEIDLFGSRPITIDEVHALSAKARRIRLQARVGASGWLTQADLR